MIFDLEEIHEKRLGLLNSLLARPLDPTLQPTSIFL